LTSGSPAPASERREQTPPRRISGQMRRLAPIKVAPLPAVDVRVRRELAHRRLVMSMLRRALRLITLHVLDAATVVMSVALAGWLTEASLARETMPALVAFVLVGLNVRGSYHPGPARRDSQRLVTGVLIATGLAVIPATLPPTLGLPASFLLYFTLAACAGLIIERQAVDAIVRQAYVRGLGLRRAVVVARAHEAPDIIAGLNASPSDHAKDRPDDQTVVGYVTPDDERSADSLGTIARLEEVLDARNVSELVVATSLRESTLSGIADLCFARGVRVFVIPPAAHHLAGWTELTRVGRWPAYHLHPTRLELPALMLKRATDLVLATIAVTLTAPLMFLIAASIKLETRGSVFFRQRRVGLGGREFQMWKFRSMLHEAESQQGQIAHLNRYSDGRLFKLAEDPRVTRVGRFLRRFSLDELPQLFNILAGDMSLVGPRPPLPKEVSTYETRHLIRLSVVPGLTGPWQVNGRNLITDFEEVVRLERAYIESWSLRSDIEIILRTLGVVLSGKGAY
jgi:exopolysaccharide biosynthesis polyprenyl glycosylphosphotransferase